MKTMTCRQPGGACDKKIHADSFEEIAAQSKQYGKEMIEKPDQVHIKTMKKMQGRMISPEAMGTWFEGKRKE